MKKRIIGLIFIFIIAFSPVLLAEKAKENHKKELESLQLQLQQFKQHKNKKGTAKILNNIADIYNRMGEYDKALEYYERAAQMAIEIDFKKGMAYYTWYIAKLYEDLNNYPLVREYHRKALEIGEKINERWVSASALISVGAINIKYRDYEKARENLERGHKIAKEINSEDLIIAGYEKLSQLSAAEGDYKKALEYYQRFHQIEQELQDIRMTRHFNELQTSYEAEKRNKEIAQLKSNNNIQQLRLSRERITRYALISGLILVSIIFALLFKKYLYLFAFWKRQRYIGHFRLTDKIGSGAMGSVYKAYNLMDKSEIAAVKILKDELFVDEVNKKRFKREAAIIDKLEHPNIIKVFERGESKQQLFIAMEFLEGKTLQDKIDNGGPLDLREGLSIMVQISDAIAFIHKKKIIHRDLKPANIMLIEKDGQLNFVKLLDFGLAKRGTFIRHYLPPADFHRRFLPVPFFFIFLFKKKLTDSFSYVKNNVMIEKIRIQNGGIAH